MTVEEQIVGGYNGSNPPFLTSLHLIRRSDVLVVLDPMRFKRPDSIMPLLPVGGIRLKDHARVSRMKFPPQTCTMELASSRTDAGVSYTGLFEFPMPGSQIIVSAWLHQNREQQMMALAETADGTVWVVGNEEQGMRPSMVHAAGAATHHLISISGTFNLPPFVLSPASEGLNLATIFPDTDFNTDFSLDFNA